MMVMGIEDLGERKKIDLKNLKEGGIYRGELIVERDDKSSLVNMKTLRRVRMGEIEISNYVVKTQRGRVIQCSLMVIRNLILTMKSTQDWINN